MDQQYVIYGMERSYFTRKLEAAFIFYDIPFKRESKTVDRVEHIEKRAATHLIPVLETPENWMIHDTTPILSMMDARYPLRRMVPLGPLGVLVSLVEEYFDEWMSGTVVHYRWHFPETTKLASELMAREIMPDGPEEGVKNIAASIAAWGLRACRANGLESISQQRAAEKEFERILVAAEIQLASTPYLLGHRPCSVDANLLGMLRAHMYIDPDPRKTLDNYPRVIEWNVEDADQWDGTGELAPFPESTEFARFILDEMKSTYGKFMIGNSNALKSNQKAFVIHIYNEDVSFKAIPYREESRQMMLQRMNYQLEEKERKTVQEWLNAIGLADCFNY